MKLTHKYKLKPTPQQVAVFVLWLDLCRRQYNYRLGQRFDWYDSTRTRVDACPLTCAITPLEDIYKHIPEYRIQTRDGRKKDAEGNPITKRGDKHPNIVGGYVEWSAVQLADLKQTKKLFSEYKQLDSQVLQDVVNRVEYAFSRFTMPDKNGKTSGRPRFKGKHYYKSFTYTQLCNAAITRDERGRNCINLAKIGLVPFVEHRSIPTGFSVKTGTVVREADGWYITLTLEDKAVPDTVAEIQPTEDNSLGLDLGLERYITLSNGVYVEHPRFLKQSANKLAKLQQRLTKHKKHSKPWKILKGKIARLHQTIARQRLDFQFKLAYFIFKQCDVLFIENLQLKNLVRRCKPKMKDGEYVPNGQAAKSGLNKSLLDAAHGQFVQVLKFVAWKLGKVVKEVNPRGTSQHCWACLNKVPKMLSDRWHECSCGESLQRDENSAKLIKRIGLVGEDITSLKTASQGEDARVLCVA